MTSSSNCPEWCDGCSRDDWSDYEHDASRHHTATIGEVDELVAAPDGSLVNVWAEVDLHAVERAVVLSNGRRGPSVLEQPVIGLALGRNVDGRGNGEVYFDLSAGKARELADWLTMAAERFDAVGEQQ